MLVTDRELSGYPGIRVELHVETDGSSHTDVIDPVGTCVLVTGKDRGKALDAYHHPFVYGYVVPDESDSDLVERVREYAA